MAKSKKRGVEPPAGWQNRILGHDLVDADQLRANPKNWRIHPGEQQTA